MTRLQIYNMLINSLLLILSTVIPYDRAQSSSNNPTMFPLKKNRTIMMDLLGRIVEKRTTRNPCTGKTVHCRITRIPRRPIHLFSGVSPIGCRSGAVSFLRFSFGRAKRKRERARRGRFVYLNCRCQWKNAASTLRTGRTIQPNDCT